MMIQKNKVTSLEIIVRMIDNKPYYEIKYKKVGEDYYHVGYSSFNIDNVLKLLDFICSIETYEEGSVMTIENGVAMCSVTEIEKWLQSEAE